MEKVKKRILVAPLNWGLGHVTRCIPIIEALLQRGIEPILASDGMALLLLKKEFPQLKSYSLPSYNIVYKSNKMLLNMAWQIPRIIKAIALEKKAIAKIVASEKIDMIISDNRYGCSNNGCLNIFMTHQLNIKIPFGPLAALVAYFNHRMIATFDECWVPDFAEEPSLAGTLSRKRNLSDVYYLGCLSRMKRRKVERKYDLAIVLSGPEPQRSYLEEKIMEQARQCTQKILLVRGLTDRDEVEIIDEHLEVRSYLTSQALNEAILASDVVLCRSGYSSLMDLVQLEKKAILIPTPGQTEQEYLAERFGMKKVCYCTAQEKIDLKRALIEVEKTKGFAQYPASESLLKMVLDRVLL